MARKLSEQLKYITNEDIEMIREAVKWLDTHYMNRTKSPGRNKINKNYQR